MMSKQPSQPTKSMRLSKVVDRVRMSSVPSARPSPGAVRYTPAVATAQKPVQRAIKYPNASTALRQHVADARPVTTREAGIRLRMPPDRRETVVDEVRAVRPTPARLTERHGIALPSRDLSGRQRARPIETAADIGELVRRARKERAMSQGKLASLAGTGRRFISDLEAGKPTIELKRLLDVCEVLEVSLFGTIDPSAR